MGTESRVTEPEHGFLGWLDSPRIVVGAALLFLLALSVFGIVLWNDQRQAVKRIDALVIQHQEQSITANKDSVSICFSNAAQGPALRRALSEIEMAIADPQARAALADLRALNVLNTPTLRECRLLAVELHVSIPRSIR